MKQSIFKFKKLNTWDKVTMALYVLISIILWYYFENGTSNKTRGDILFGYSFGTQFFLYGLNYKSLRNLLVYIFWIVIGLIHLFFYFQLKDVAMFQRPGGHIAIGLRNTIIMLSFFQVLRFISLKIQGQELVCPSKYSRTDTFDDREVTQVDFFLFFIYVGMLIILLFND